MDFFETGPILFDGGIGSMLIAAGLPAGCAPEAWNLAEPHKVKSVHTAYLKAGAHVVTTNTFGGTPGKIAGSGLKHGCNEINLAGAKLAREAVLELAKERKGDPREEDGHRIEAGAIGGGGESLREPGSQVEPPDSAKSIGQRRRLVALSMGPTGRMLPPVGNATEEELTEEFLKQASSAINLVDLIVIETMFDLREALCALKAAKAAQAVPVGVTMTFDRKRGGFFTIMGDEAAPAVKTLEGAGADFVGANCTLTSDSMVDLARVIRDATGIPVLCQPNAGLPRIEKGMPVYDQPPGAFADDMMQMVEMGINAVGGCCGTTPEFTKELSRRISGA